MRIMLNDLMKEAGKKLDATELVVLAKRDWDNITECPEADGVVYLTVRTVD